MAKKLRKLCAVLLALVMCVSLLPTSAFAMQRDFPLDKTANGLDANDQTDVTLTVPGSVDALGSDIIYIVGSYAANEDGSPNVDGDVLISSLVATMREMVEAGTHVNFGMVPFSSDNVVAMPLTRIDASNIDQLPDMIADALATCKALYDAVNMENALRKAKKLFSDPSNPLANHPERQHLVMISSGFTYFFNSGENNENVATVPVRINDNYLRYTNRGWMQARTGQGDTYPLPKAFSTYNDSRDWDLYWSYIDQWARADIAAGDEVVYEAASVESADFLNWYSSGSGSSSGVGKYITGTFTEEELAKYPYVTRIGGYNVKNPLEEPSAQHAILYERAMWEAYEYAKADITGAGINFYPIYNALSYKYTNGYRPDAAAIDWTTQYIGHSFMNMLAGGEAIKYETKGDKTFFDPIKDQILYSTAIGSTVEDFIGCNENGDFEFIEDAACITLNVGGKDYITTKTSDTEEGSSYAFAASADAEPTFWLDYTYGDGKTTEKFIWTFGENVSMANVAKLTYKLQLTEKQSVEGTYTVPTNNSATLYPVDSEGKPGTPEVFPVPEVTYDVVIPGGDIIVAKVDQNGNPVTGASFELFDAEGNSLGEYAVDANGKITFKDLPVGTYKLVETVTPAGYIGVSEPIYFEVVRTAKGEFEAKDAYELHFPATAYEISNHSFYPAIPQTFVMLDAEDVEGWEYSETADFQVVYCGDSETGGEDGVKYYRAPLEEVYGDVAGKIRAIVENSYPYVSMVDMIDAAVAAGVADAANLTRGDLIAAVQLAIWNYTNGGGYTYRATYSVNGRPEWGYVYNDYEDELPDSLPKGNTKTSIKDAASIARIDALFNYLINLPAAADSDEFEAFAYVAEGGKSASQTMIGCDGTDFYTEGNVIFVKNVQELEDIPEEDPPLGNVPEIPTADKTSTLIDREENLFEIEVRVPGVDGVEIHDEVIMMVDGSYSGDDEWPAMKAAINAVGETVLNGNGNTQLTLMAFGMGDNIVLEHIKDADELAAILGELPGYLLYGRSSTNCEVGFKGVSEYIKNHDNTLNKVNIVYISDGEINMDETERNFFNWKAMAEGAYWGTAIKTAYVRFECALYYGHNVPEAMYTVFGDRISGMTNREILDYAFLGGATDEEFLAVMDEVYKDVYAYSGLYTAVKYPISVVERAFVKYDKDHGTNIQDIFYEAIYNSPAISYPNKVERAVAAANALADMNQVSQLYIVDTNKVSAWMQLGNEKATFIQSNGIGGLCDALAGALTTLAKTPFNDVVVTDYMSEWVNLDVNSLKIVDNSTGAAIWTAVDGWLINEGRPTAQEIPVVVELVDPADYAAGGDDVIGNTNGDIYKLTWYVKDGAMLRSDTYSLKYNVVVDTAESGFVADTQLPSNGNTDLHYTDENGNRKTEEIEVPTVDAPLPEEKTPTITFKSGQASNISFMLIDKATGKVEFVEKIDIGSQTSFEIPTAEGKISAVFVKQSTSGMFWASEEIDEKTQNAVIKCLKANNPSYKGHWAEFFFGEGDCTWEFKKNKSVTYTFSNVGATVEAAKPVVTPEVEAPVAPPKAEEPVAPPKAEKPAEVEKKAEITVKGAEETSRKTIGGVTVIYIAANGKIPAVIWAESDTGLSNAELIAEFGAGSDAKVIFGLGKHTIEYQQNKNKTKTVTYTFEVK